MNELRLIEASSLKSLLALLNDNSLPVGPVVVQYANYAVRNSGSQTAQPLRFTWQRGSQRDSLTFALVTWDTAAGRASPGSYLVLRNAENSEMMGFSLAQLPQDDTHVLLGFKMGNGEGGKNRWFGRRRDDPRPPDATIELARELKRAWQGLFSEVLPKHPTLGGEWLVLARLPLDDLRPDAGLNRHMALKTLVLQQLAHAFVVAEKLRDESFSGFENVIPDEKIPIQPVSAILPVALHPLNQILFGPPGTGKTYATAAWALALIENKPFAEIEARYRHDQRTLQRVLEMYKSRKQVRFVTFHQSFSYEDFVEGIKPNLNGEGEVSYKVDPGVFRLIADDATQDWLRSTAAPGVVLEVDKLPFPLVYEAYIADLLSRLAASSDGTVSIPTVGNYSAIVTAVSPLGVISVRHSTGPIQYNIKPFWTDAVYQRYAQASDIVPMNKKMLEIGGPNATLQWAIFNDLKTYETAHRQELEAQIVNEEVTEVISDTASNYVLIIDEINRGNVASIFGELITLLEDDKRTGTDNALSITLPYSKDTRPPFSVPPNLFVLGTMNTADRSVEALDTALRRRFSFVEMSPKPKLLSPAQMIFRFRYKASFTEQPWQEPAYVKAERQLFDLLGCPTLGGEAMQKSLWQALNSESTEQQIEDAFAPVYFSGVNLEKLLATLNQRLEYLLGRDYCLGHAWLMGVGSLDGLRAAFRNKVIPQLQDFFPGNWGRIGQILGSRFVVEQQVATSPLLEFGEEEEPEGRTLYAIRAVDWTIEDFRSIYQSSSKSKPTS
jgi:hypothetical protein